MSLNIKNPRVHALAREAARRTGRSQTSVIEQALEKFLHDLEPEGPQTLEADLMWLAEDCAHRITDEDRRLLTTDDLYDDRGLPA